MQLVSCETGTIQKENSMPPNQHTFLDMDLCWCSKIFLLFSSSNFAFLISSSRFIRSSSVSLSCSSSLSEDEDEEDDATLCSSSLGCAGSICCGGEKFDSRKDEWEKRSRRNGDQNMTPRVHAQKIWHVTQRDGGRTTHEINDARRDDGCAKIVISCNVTFRDWCALRGIDRLSLSAPLQSFTQSIKTPSYTHKLIHSPNIIPFHFYRSTSYGQDKNGRQSSFDALLHLRHKSDEAHLTDHSRMNDCSRCSMSLEFIVRIFAVGISPPHFQ